MCQGSQQIAKITTTVIIILMVFFLWFCEGEVLLAVPIVERLDSSMDIYETIYDKLIIGLSKKNHITPKVIH